MFTLTTAQNIDNAYQQTTPAAAVSVFLANCDAKSSTLSAYETALRSFVFWLRSEGIQQPQKADIIEYKQYLQTARSQTGKPYSVPTQARYLRAVKTFFRWAAAEGICANVAENVKPARTAAGASYRDELGEDGARAVLGAIDRTTEAGARDYAMILLALSAGLRVVELQRANIEDFKTLAGLPVLYIQGKGHDSKDTPIKIAPAVGDALREYLAFRQPLNAADPLFCGAGNRSRGRLSVPGISRIIKQAIEAGGFCSHTLTAHSLRHTSVSTYLRAGATIQEAQQHARHASPLTTEIYAHNLKWEKIRSEEIVAARILGGAATDPEKPEAQETTAGAPDPLEAIKDELRALTDEQRQAIKAFLEGGL